MTRSTAEREQELDAILPQLEALQHAVDNVWQACHERGWQPAFTAEQIATSVQARQTIWLLGTQEED